MTDYLEIYKATVKPFGDAVIAWARPEGWMEAPTSVCAKQTTLCLSMHSLVFHINHF